MVTTPELLVPGGHVVVIDAEFCLKLPHCLRLIIIYMHGMKALRPLSGDLHEFFMGAAAIDLSQAASFWCRTGNFDSCWRHQSLGPVGVTTRIHQDGRMDWHLQG